MNTTYAAFQQTTAYRNYIAASARCADAFAGITVEPHTVRGRVIGYWLSINGRLVESGTKRGDFKSDMTARAHGHRVISGEQARIDRERQEAEIAAAHAQALADSGILLATERQVNYIMDLLKRNEPAGFYYGPRNRAGVASMTRAEASTYITSLTGAY